MLMPNESVEVVERERLDDMVGKVRAILSDKHMAPVVALTKLDLIFYPKAHLRCVSCGRSDDDPTK